MQVLFVVLNWGMGHASRSIPIIRFLQQQGHQVHLASDGQALNLLEAEFPELKVHPLPGYGVVYPTRNIYLNVLLSLPYILKARFAERRWINAFIKDNTIDLLVSDNRYGCTHPDIYAILITHQLKLIGSWTWANRLGEFFIHAWIRRFNEVWVPDYPDARLTGEMVRWSTEHPPIHFIGPLSRFTSGDRQEQPEYAIIAVLSGPEPQRSLFEAALIQQLSRMEGRHLIVRGTREKLNIRYTDNQGKGQLQFEEVLTAQQIQHYRERAKMQICRAGYSTIMDLVLQPVPTLLVPTPGQFEQEYLAKHLKGKGPWLFQDQSHLDISKAWATCHQWAVERAYSAVGQQLTCWKQRLDNIAATRV